MSSGFNTLWAHPCFHSALNILSAFENPPNSPFGSQILQSFHEAYSWVKIKPILLAYGKNSSDQTKLEMVRYNIITTSNTDLLKSK